MPDQKLIRQQLYRLTDQEDLSLDFVSALAGDREFTAGEKRLYQKLSEDRGEFLYVDLLFVLTHQYYPEKTARKLWNQILEHKKSVSRKLGRNVGITVSIGCAMCPEDRKSGKVLIKKADEALYYLKESGINQVPAYQDITRILHANQRNEHFAAILYFCCSISWLI